jgi:hypothetical protein
MQDILQRFHQTGAEDSSQSEGEEDEPTMSALSAETLARLALEDSPSLEALSEDERRAFLRAAGSGQLRRAARLRPVPVPHASFAATC